MLEVVDARKKRQICLSKALDRKLRAERDDDHVSDTSHEHCRIQRVARNLEVVVAERLLKVVVVIVERHEWDMTIDQRRAQRRNAATRNKDGLWSLGDLTAQIRTESKSRS